MVNIQYFLMHLLCKIEKGLVIKQNKHFHLIYMGELDISLCFNFENVFRAAVCREESSIIQ